MKVINQSKQSVTLELSPMELSLFRSAIIKESGSRRNTWKKVEPKFPEEVMYHAEMNHTAERMKVETHKIVRKYQDWGILK